MSKPNICPRCFTVNPDRKAVCYICGKSMLPEGFLTECITAKDPAAKLAELLGMDFEDNDNQQQKEL